MEVWGGNQATFAAFEKAGLDIWLYSRPFGTDASGGDLYYLSSCASGRITRMLVADVASDSNTSRVLHEGTGHFNPLIVVYTPPGGEPIAGIGYIFSHYEFAEPDWNRLNDAEWARRLQENPPPRPAWASGFLSLLAQLEIIYLPLVLK